MRTFYQHIMKPIILGTIILTMSIGMFTIFFMNKMITPDIEKLAHSILNLKIEEIDNWLSDYIATNDRLADSLATTSLTTDNKQEVLSILAAAKQKKESDYESMGFITTDGDKYLTNGSHFTVTNRNYFQKLSHSFDRTHLSMAISSQANQANVVLIISKVFDDKNNIRGYVSSAIPIDYMKDAVDSSDNLFSTYIYHVKTEEALLGESQKTRTFLELDRPIPSNPDWRIRLTISRKNALLSLRKTIIFIVILTLCLTLLSTEIMKRRLGKITQPLQDLEQKIADVSEGSYVEITPNTTITELKSIGETFNTMVTNINAQQHIIKKQAQQKNEAEQRALYAQIKPHFLYNTLQTIQAMAFDLDSLLIEEAIGELATFYRIGLSSDAQIIPLEKECQHIISYLNILLLRYDSLFTYHIDNQSHSNHYFLKFTIQPLVENAIYHGIKPLGQSGHITITISESSKDLFVTVTNPSPHLTEREVVRINEMIQQQTPQDSYGLYNVNQRLMLQFGPDYGVSVALKDGLFVATIKQPILKGARYEYTCR